MQTILDLMKRLTEIEKSLELLDMTFTESVNDYLLLERRIIEMEQKKGTPDIFDLKEKGKEEMFNEAWKHTPITLLDNEQNLWWAKMLYKYKGQKLTEAKK